MRLPSQAELANQTSHEKSHTELKPQDTCKATDRSGGRAAGTAEAFYPAFGRDQLGDGWVWASAASSPAFPFQAQSWL